MKPPHFSLTYLPEVIGDLVELAQIDPTLVDAAFAALSDLAHGRQRGKLLGDRHVTGDLSGLARLRFDLPNVRPLRYRIVYRRLNDAAAEVVAIGERADHAAYRVSIDRR